jgi:PLP dependent protein
VVGRDEIAAAVRRTGERIEAARRRSGRGPEEVTLIAVTKGVSPEAIRIALEAGVRDFGENYAQDLVSKREAVPDARWHFIGRLQRNKVARVVAAADLVHSLERGAASRRVADAGAERGRPVECLVEVDFTEGRVGVPPDQLRRFVDEAMSQPGLSLRGLMTVPPLEGEPRRFFARLRELLEGLRETHPGLRELSMGMSADYEEAVEEGATMVRIGTAIFGPRPATVHGQAGKP